jgi:glycosyltransferase involved in cell wall biosynthesis
LIKNILITFVVVNCNKDKYLNACLNSLINQNIENIEIILIDDNSNDNSLKTLKKFQGKLKIIKLKKNYGVSFCRNLGIKKSNGKYIAFVDADDKIYHNIKKIINKILNQKNYNELIFLKFSGTDKNCNNNSLFKKKFQELKTDAFIKIYFSKLLQLESIWFVLFKREFLNKNLYFLENSDCLEDMEFITKSLCLSNFCALVDIKYYYYRETVDSLKKVYSHKRALGAYNVYKSLEYFKKKKNLSQIRKRLLERRVKFAKIMSIMRFYLSDNHLLKTVFKNEILRIKKSIKKKFFINNKSKIAIYCFGPAGQFLCKILEELKVLDIIFIDDNKFLSNYKSKYHFCKFNKNLLKSHKIIIANNKKQIISNIKKKINFKVFQFNVETLLK